MEQSSCVNCESKFLNNRMVNGRLVFRGRECKMKLKRVSVIHEKSLKKVSLSCEIVLV